MGESDQQSNKRHLVVYISGPLSAPYNDRWFTHIIRARSACRELWMLGVTPICPHLNSLFMEGVVSYEEFLLGDLELVKRSNAIYMIGHWMNSKGAMQEHKFAEFHNIPILCTMTTLRWWVRDQPPDNSEEEQ